jgi:hypothetical protein
MSIGFVHESTFSGKIATLAGAKHRAEPAMGENHLLKLIEAARKALQMGDLERCAWLLWLARCEAASLLKSRSDPPIGA